MLGLRETSFPQKMDLKHPAPHVSAALHSFAIHSLAWQQILQETTGATLGLKIIHHLIQRVRLTLWVSTGCPSLVRNTGISPQVIHSCENRDQCWHHYTQLSLVVHLYIHMHSVLCLQSKLFIKIFLYLLLGKLRILNVY